jgi:UDP-N-acetylmuramate dehydrogenase
MIDVKPRNTDGPAVPPLRGELRTDEPMSKHTSWRVGGPARRFYTPADVEDLQCFLAGLPPQEPLLWLGLGSNLLVRDGGIRGTVIDTGALGGLELCDDGSVRAEAGVSCPKAARFCARRNLGGAEFLAGIPGTMGGALAMNAGAFGCATWELVAAVETVDRRGARHTRRPVDYRVCYREVIGPADEWFVAANLRLPPGDGNASQARIKALLNKRAESQPVQQHSCGSVFRNPPGDYAGRLIEACGLKDAHVGGARVSTKHANFIVNTGTATATDIEELIERVAKTVNDTRGVRLIPEVKIVGERRG